MATSKLGDKPEKYLKTAGTHADGKGLYLRVRAPGQGSWTVKFGTKEKSLGPFDLVSADEARATHHAMRIEKKNGRDPFQLLARALAEPAGKTFAEAMTEYLAAKSPHWAASNRARELRRYAYLFDQIPDFTAKPIKAIDQATKNKALATWDGQTKARRDVGFYIEAIIRFAETGKLRIVGGGSDEVEHHEAMPYRDVPVFYARLAKLNSDDGRALRFTILTGARTDEVIGAEYKGEITKSPATWGEITEVDGLQTWIIPGSRMKGKKTHRVPLSAAAVALLGERRADNVPLFDVSGSNAMLNTLKANGGNGYTVHGFRTSFSDWVTETTAYGSDLADMCIAHETRGKVRKAYQRSDLLEKRREILQEWSDFCTTKDVGQ